MLAPDDQGEIIVSGDKKVVFITGCASGIGEATALYFGARGVTVFGCDLNQQGGEAVMAKITQGGGTGMFVKADVSSEAEIEAAVARAIAQFGHIDYAVNNAGIEGALVPFEETEVSDFDHVMSVNLRGVFICMKHQLRHMRPRNAGSIVNIASVMGMVGAPMIIQYVAAKHAVIGLTKSAAAEFAESDVRINAICPGGVETEMVRTILREQPKALEPVLAAIPAKRLAQPEEIAKTIYWVCAEAPAYLTGAALPVDGAFTAV
jgi:NAD(P)-dependent dehydrogenase (short-subunit alcohol dehydrogenase family)